MYVDNYAQSIEGVCCLFFSRDDEKFEQLEVILAALIDDIIRIELGEIPEHQSTNDY
jgi:hypothetical protein